MWDLFYLVYNFDAEFWVFEKNICLKKSFGIPPMWNPDASHTEDESGLKTIEFPIVPGG